jgi:glycosyltransferase involved in cell wall biosynthesis
MRPNRFLNPNQNEKFNPYENLKILKPIEVKVVDERFETKNNGLKFSVITPVRNEGESIYRFLCRIKDQTLKPEEVVVVENSSTDNTLSEIQRFIKDYGKEVNIKLIVSKEKGLARDRNIGIKEATNEILILLDAGVEFGNDLFEMLLATFSEFPSADLIAGIYEPTEENVWSKSFVWDWKSIDYANYIPSSRCLLIKRSKVLSMGGYPEFLPYTGEDTLFAIRYRKISNLWIINKRIKVLWHAPTNKKEAFKKAFLYGWGDGLIGLGEFRYYKELSKWLKSGGLKKWWIKSRFIRHSVVREHFKGFLKGRKERNEYLRNDINGVWLILSLVPFTDSGGGQRCTQLSLELMKNKNKVVFCNVYPSFEEKKEVYLDIEPELLELYQIKDFNIKDFWERHKMFSEGMAVLLEAPHPEFIPIVNQMKSLNPQTKVIYDCIDNWDSSLGWIWYKKEVEHEVISLADFITASAETLRERMQSLTSKPVYLIPNAVNTRVFKKDNCYITPKDLPTDKPIAIYVGAMWGEWFDWDLLYEIAKEFNINLVLIGNCPQERLSELKKYENIYYLGLKPQFELPAYLSQANIALIPFKYDDKIIKYTNPLKVYEYLAMGLPVVATYMDELVGLPYVFLSKTYEEFKENMKRTLEFVVDYDRLKEFVENNSWTARVRTLLEVVKG